MSSLDLYLAKNERGEPCAILVHRRHDLSGTDYERLGRLEIGLATKLGRDGVVIRSASAPRFAGTPGVVFSNGPSPYQESLDVRTDVADETTTMKTIVSATNMSDEVLGRMDSGRVEWLYGEPQE